MIHHCRLVTLVDTPRASIRHPRRGRAVAGALSALALMLSIAASLGAQSPGKGGKGARSAPPVDSAAAFFRAANWTGDRRSYMIGDIIKVAVDESALASVNADNASSASRKRTMNLGISPPSTGAAGAAVTNIDGSVQSSDQGASQSNGKATRGTRYLGEIPVRIIAVTPEGLLQVKGTKLIAVDKNKQEMTLTGFVRPQDVNSQDMIESASIADVQLSYKAKGGLGKPKNGIISKIIGIIWP